MDSMNCMLVQLVMADCQYTVQHDYCCNRRIGRSACFSLFHMLVKTFLKTRDQVQDLHGNYSRPRPRPWPFGLETKTETFEK